jgi:hypothetical protein
MAIKPRKVGTICAASGSFAKFASTIGAVGPERPDGKSSIP